MYFALYLDFFHAQRSISSPNVREFFFPDFHWIPPIFPNCALFLAKNCPKRHTHMKWLTMRTLYGREREKVEKKKIGAFELVHYWAHLQRIGRKIHFLFHFLFEFTRFPPSRAPTHTHQTRTHTLTHHRSEKYREIVWLSSPRAAVNWKPNFLRQNLFRLQIRIRTVSACVNINNLNFWSGECWIVWCFSLSRCVFRCMRSSKQCVAACIYTNFYSLFDIFDTLWGPVEIMVYVRETLRSLFTACANSFYCEYNMYIQQYRMRLRSHALWCIRMLSACVQNSFFVRIWVNLICMSLQFDGFHFKIGFFFTFSLKFIYFSSKNIFFTN